MSYKIAGTNVEERISQDPTLHIIHWALWKIALRKSYLVVIYKKIKSELRIWTKGLSRNYEMETGNFDFAGKRLLTHQVSHSYYMSIFIMQTTFCWSLQLCHSSKLTCTKDATILNFDKVDS
ncbi:hypothetical protein ACU8KH_05207 [Lachancea thermotolerans]